ncbi:MAG: hypothetical protein AABZ80_00625 [Gemmatimonadota bacterium]
MSADKNIEPAFSGPATEAEPDARRFRRTLIRVLAVQVVALVLLFLLQYTFRP